MLGKCCAQSSCQKENFVITLEKQIIKFFFSALIHMKTRVSLKYFVNDYRLQKH